MTTLLEQAVAKARALSAAEQDALAQLMLDEIESERKWDAVLAKSPEKLKKIGDQAMEEYQAGRTDPLDPDRL